MNGTPMVLQGCLAVVALSLILEHTFRSRAAFLKKSGRCGKLRYPKLNKFGACSIMRVIGEKGCVDFHLLAAYMEAYYLRIVSSS